MSHRRALTLAAASLLALGLTACGDDAAKPETESASTSAGPTTSAAPATTSTAAETTPAATPPASTAPAVAAPDPADYPGMDQQTEEGAKQFVRYYLAVNYYSFATGDTAEVSRISGDACTFCSDSIASATKLHQDGGYWEVPCLEFIEQAAAPVEGYAMGVESRIRVPSYRARESTNAPLSEQSEETLLVSVGLEWVEDHWEVQDVFFSE